MKDIKVFSTVEEVYEILGKKAPTKYYDDPFYEELWSAGFDFDDWDIGFACKGPFTHIEHEDGYKDWEEADDDVDWLVNRMKNYCCGYRYIEYGGWYWYFVYHS